MTRMEFISLQKKAKIADETRPNFSECNGSCSRKLNHMPCMSEYKKLFEGTDKSAGELETTAEKLGAFIKENR